MSDEPAHSSPTPAKATPRVSATRSKGPSRSKGERRGKKRPGGSPALGLFLLFGAAPIGIVIYFFTLSADKQQAILDKIPKGIGGRALVAAAFVVLLVVLARLALPAFHGASAALKSGMEWIRRQNKGLRILLFPVELVLWLVWFVAQMLFALDALAIVACALGALLATVRILKPDFLPEVLPQLGKLLQ